MSKLAIIQHSLDAIRSFRAYHRERGTLAMLLQPAFNMLTMETRLHLATSSMIEMCVANIEAKKRWGDDGNVMIAGNVLRVGVSPEGGSFVEHGRGRTAREAFERVDEGSLP